MDNTWYKEDHKMRNTISRRYQRTRRTEHWIVYNRIKAELSVKIAEAKIEHKNKLIRKLGDAQNSTNNFWTVVKQVYGSKTKCSIPTPIDGAQHYNTSDDKASIVVDHFEAQTQEPNLPPNHTEPAVHRHHTGSKLVNIVISEEEVRAELRKLKIGKTMGPDGVSNELLKMIAGSVAPSLTTLFNNVVQTGCYPDIWKQAHVSPIHKQGSRQDKKNYRPISLLSTTGKFLERILFNKMYTFLTKQNPLTWRNSGIHIQAQCTHTSEMTTTNRTTRILDDIHKTLDRREESCLIFLDQSKAFDRIHHNSLRRKLQVKGIDGKLLQLLAKGYYHLGK